MTNGWPYARPTTLYQSEHAAFISLSEGAGRFWYSQVEVIGSYLYTVEIYIKDHVACVSRSLEC